ATWTDHDGKATPAGGGDLGMALSLALSPDGKRVALTINEQGTIDLWVLEFARGVKTRLTFNAAQEWDPSWTPDGREILYTDHSQDAVYAIAADGTGQPRKIAPGALGVVSADG